MSRPVYHNNENRVNPAQIAGPNWRRMVRALAGAWSGATEIILAERDRWALWLPPGMAAGAGLYFALMTEPAWWMGAGLLALAGGLWLGWRNSQLAVILALAIAAPAAGFTAGQIRTHAVAAPVIEREIGPVSVRGRIVVAEMRPNDRRLTLDRLTVGDLAPRQTPARIRVTVRARGTEVAPGDWVTLRAVLLPPSPPAAPGRSILPATPGSTAWARWGTRSARQPWRTGRPRAPGEGWPPSAMPCRNVSAPTWVANKGPWPRRS